MSNKHVHTSGPSLKPTSPLTPPLKSRLLLYEKGLIKLTEATDVSMIESCRQAVTDLAQERKAAAILSLTPDSQHTSLIRRLLYLTIPAVANCMRIIVQQGQTSVFNLSHTTELSAADTTSHDILLTVVQDFELMFMRLRAEVAQQPVLSRIKAAGLIPAFIDYSQAAIKALERLAARYTCCTEQQQSDANNQQQQQLRDGVASAVAVTHEVLELWTCLFASAIGSKGLEDDLVAAAPTVVQLTVSSVPLLQTALSKCSDSSSCCSSKKADWTTFYLQELCVLRDRAQELAVFITLVMIRTQASDHGDIAVQQQQQQQQQWQQSKQSKELVEPKKPLHLPPDHAMRLLLLTLIRQADRLHHSSNRSSLSGSGTTQQHQQQQQSAKQHAIFSSHTAVLMELGFPTAPAASFAGRQAGSRYVVEPVPVEVVCHYSIFFLQDLIAHCSGSDSSSSSSRHCTKSADVKRNHGDHHHQQQQQHEQTCQLQLLHHLLLPTVKLFVEIVLLLPENDVQYRAMGLKAILLLLQAAQAALSKEGAAAAAAAGSGIVPWAPLLAAIAGARRSVTEADVGPWNLTLPVTTAAGLLVPVMQLMSRVVIHSLKMTETQQKQQQQQKVAGGRASAKKQKAVFAGSSVMAATTNSSSSIDSSTMMVEATAAPRVLLLHYFGNLLMVVCKSVKPKHIAAALEHDSVMPLIAVEAVIRAQACRLMAAGWSQQQWQQQQWQHQRQYRQQQRGQKWLHQAAAPQAYAYEASSSASTRTDASSLKSTEYPDGASTELLLFVSRVLEALHTLQQQLWGPLLQATYMTSKEVPELLLRIFTMVTTACKTYQAVIAAAAAAPAPAKADIRQQSKYLQGLLDLWQRKQGLQAAGIVADACNLVVLSLNRSIDCRVSHHGSSGNPCNIQWQLHLCHYVTARVMSGDTTKTLMFMLQQNQQEISSLATETSGTSATDIAMCLQQLATTDMQVTKQLQTADLEQQDDNVLEEQYVEQKRILADHNFSCSILPWCCNNPSCSDLSKLSEYQLVSGKACVCGGCQVARYCSKECQQGHWKQHKGSCHKLTKEQS